MSLVFAMPGNDELADELASVAGSSSARIEFRRFPDGEGYVRIGGEPRNKDVFLVCTLAHPDEQFLPLVFAVRALRAAGAKSVTLVAPYLAYMRQDRAFHAGEAVSSRIFADLIGREFDRLITVDPHLHRYASLGEIYTFPTTVVHAGAMIGTWVGDHVRAPVVLGPDAESMQWVEEIARVARCPWTVFRKERSSDREVQLTAPALEQFGKRTPVLVDDIISTGATMIEAAKVLIAAGMQQPHCIAVHGLFGEATVSELRAVTQSLLTTDSVPNPYARLKLAPLIAEQLAPSSA